MKPESRSLEKFERSWSVKPALWRLALGWERSISWWATLRSPQTMTGSFLASLFRYDLNSGSQCLSR